MNHERAGQFLVEAAIALMDADLNRAVGAAGGSSCARGLDIGLFHAGNMSARFA